MGALRLMANNAAIFLPNAVSLPEDETGFAYFSCGRFEARADVFLLHASNSIGLADPPIFIGPANLGQGGSLIQLQVNAVKLSTLLDAASPGTSDAFMSSSQLCCSILPLVSSS